jgi:cytidine deaminase
MSGIEELFAAAAAARRNAYAPYSGFTVGAAIRTPSGAIYCGANVENASSPVGACAEAGAISAMVVAGERKISELLVIGDGDAPVTHCGACRQRLLEFAADEAIIHAAGPHGIRASFSMAGLLPQAFRRGSTSR